ncbi:MAG: EVE domain-containing protein, partial [Phycisphaerales bacterium]
MATFLFKTEPTEYAFDRLLAEKRAVWNGIANNAALAALRTARKGDEAFIYHTGDEKAIVALARILTDAYEDPANPGKDASGRPRIPVVDIAPLRAAASPVTLAAIKSDKRFKDFALVRQP